MNATPTNGVAPLTRAVLQRGLARSRTRATRSASRGTSTATARSTRPTRTRRYVYTTNGVYTAKLTVTDSAGKTDTKTLTITVGNTAPTIKINTPLDGDFFEWGDKIPYTVTVTDPEDGADRLLAGRS